MTNASNEFVADKVLDKGQRAPGGENTTRPSGQPIATENTSITAGENGPVVLLSLIHI